jgi:lipopolysaccharide biosynthesis regulator YciM
MVELFWLLLPIAAFSGWWIGRYRSQQEHDDRAPPLPADYLRGLNFVLNEQPDKAVDVFLKMVEVDSETVETHLALGSLFRRRGEVDRAIRIHQNLIARPNLSAKQRLTALYHLGLDYMSAGVLDRAENLFIQLLSNDEFRESSLLQLFEIYQQQHDWEQAIKTVEQLTTQKQALIQQILTHLHCELVEESRLQGATDRAQKFLKKAAVYNTKHIRVQILQARLLQDKGHYKQSLRVYSQLVLEHPGVIPILLNDIARIYGALDRNEEFVDFLRDIVTKLNNEVEIALLLNVLFSQEKDINFIEQMIEKAEGRANLWTLRVLILVFLERSVESENNYLKQLKSFVEKLMNEKSSFQCRQCGFSGYEFYWQCPSCKTWDTVKPVHGSLSFDLPEQATTMNNIKCEVI